MQNLNKAPKIKEERNMKERIIAFSLMTSLILTLCLAGCGKTVDAPAKESAEATTEDFAGMEEEPEFAGAAYGYAGDDPVELACYKYMVEEKSKDYDKADVSIPIVQIVNTDFTEGDEITVAGDFWINNYMIEGDTLKCVSGGNYPGIMHLTGQGDNYTVTKMDIVADGEDFNASAKKLFGDNYDAFMNVYSDQDAREEARKITVSDYVNMNGLSVTKYQDEGWKPVELYSN